MDLIILLYSVMFFFGIFFVLIFIILHYENRKKLFDFPEIKSFPKISFLVPAYNEQNTIKNTVEALLKTEYPNNQPSYERCIT